MKHELTKILDAIFHFYDLAGYFELLLVVERGGIRNIIVDLINFVFVINL